MKRRILLALVLAAVLAAPALAGPDAAAIPGDADGDMHLTRAELAGAILGYLRDGGSAGAATGRQDVQDAACVYSCWGGTPLEVTDSAGRETVMVRPLRRVVVFNGETLETLRSLDFETERIVGIDKYSMEKSAFFPEFQDAENVGSIWSPDLERVVSLRPDAVFLYATISTGACDEIQAKLQSSDPSIRIFRFDCYKPASYMDEVETVGAITGREEEAARFAAFYTGIMDRIAGEVAALSEGDRVPVYFEYYDEYKTVATGSGYDEKIRLAGGRNLFADEPAEYPNIEPEAVIAANPSVVIKLVGKKLEFGGYRGGDAAPFAALQHQIMARPGWWSLDAVQQQRVYLIHSDLLGGAQHFIGTAYLAEWFSPERFAGLDPGTLHRQYLREFQHLAFDPLTDGIFVYP
ncbi:MAG TPA: ABC transporter substrate-binding protein [Methanoculleus sp.]|nr:ABC transporter substrate-binding protein [Methanoculleus sp.]